MATTDALLKISPEEHIANRKSKYSGSKELLRFPENIGAHATLMRFFEYTYGGAKGSIETPLAEILLPLPKQIQDSFKINVGGNEVGVLAAGAAQAAANLGGEGGVMDMTKALAGAAADAAEGVGAAAANALTGDFSGFKSGMAKTADAAGYLASAGLSKIAPDITNAMGAGRGTAVNPFQTLVFKGIDLKIHSLEWLLSPESEQESLELKKIIRTLQRMVLPKTASPLGEDATGITAIDKGILKYPAMVNIFLQGLDQNYYFKFKTSMISNLAIDYTPNGVAPLKGGKPSAVRITMTLNEAYIHTADDNELSDLEAEYLNESLLGSVEDEAIVPRVNASEQAYDADEDFTGLQASDEIKITKKLPDGSQVSQVVTKDLLNAQGITDAEIAQGFPAGDETVILEAVSEENE
jgi:hypothetical protein